MVSYPFCAIVSLVSLVNATKLPIASEIGKDFKNMYMTSFLQLLIDKGWKAKAVQVSNGWLEVDSLEDIRQYEKMAEDGLLDRFYKVEC